MESSNVNPPVWVDSSEKLRQLVTRLAAEPRLAVDTESNSLFAYKERVCLIQISTPAVDYLLDPFELTDLSSLGPIFANTNIEKIFHAAEYDLICLKRDYHFEFNHLFDTMLAARILGLQEIGLGALLQVRFGLTLDKRYQRANWGIRPIKDEMLAYAALDTHYLFELRNSLQSDLSNRNLLPLAEEDFRAVTRVEGHAQNGTNTNCWKVAGATRINPRQAAILDQLCIFRDEQARKADLPHFKVMTNKVLVDLCISEIETPEDLAGVEGMTIKVMHRYGQSLLKAIKKGQEAPPLTKPPRIKADPRFVDRIEKLKTWRKNTAKEIKVESDVVLPKELMESLAYHTPHTQKELSALMRDYPYRNMIYGKKLLAILKQEDGE
jgi:ribonuclease D